VLSFDGVADVPGAPVAVPIQVPRAQYELLMLCRVVAIAIAIVRFPFCHNLFGCFTC
jgi:hypothetical protein